MTPNDLKRREVLLAGREQRLQLIRQIQQHRKSKVICLLVSDRQNVTGNLAQDVVSPFAQVVDQLRSEEPGLSTLDLWVYGPGGELPAACAVHGILSTKLHPSCEVSVLVPFKAHSAFTFVALGAQRVVMGETGILSPIDAQVHKQEKGAVVKRFSVEDIRGLFVFATELLGAKGSRSLSPVMDKLLSEIDPTVLGMVGRSIEHWRKVGLCLLRNRETRCAAKGKAPRSERALSRIVDHFTTEHGLHGHPIFFHEAQALGLDWAEKADDLTGRLAWELYLRFAADLDLERPLWPGTVWHRADPADDDRLVLKDACFALLETEDTLWAFLADMTFTRQAQGDVKINVNLPGIQLPVPGVPRPAPEVSVAPNSPAPAGGEAPKTPLPKQGAGALVEQGHIQAAVFQAVQRAVEEQVRRARQALPFQISAPAVHNAGWTRLCP